MCTFVLTVMFYNFSRYTLRLLTFIRLLHTNLLLPLFKNTMVLPITVVNQLYHAFTMILPWYINYTRMQTGYSVVSLRY